MPATVKNIGKRLVCLLLLALVSVNLFLPIVPAEAGIANQYVWYIQMSVDTATWSLVGGVVTDKVGRVTGVSKEGARMTSDELADLASFNPTTAIGVLDGIAGEREENNNNQSGLVLTYPDETGTFSGSATQADKDSAEMVLASLLYDFNNAFHAAYNVNNISSVDDFQSKVSSFLTAVYGNSTISADTVYSSISISGADMDKYPEGLGASNYKKFTMTKGGNTETVYFCTSVPKKIPAPGDEISWATLAAEAFANYYCGVEAGAVYSGEVGFFEEHLVGFFGSVIDWAAGALGLWSLDELIFNSGMRGSSAYAYGIFPIAWQSTIWTFFFISELISVSILMFCIINNVVRKALSTVNPVSRASAMAQVMDLLKVVALLVMLPFLLQLGMGLSESLAKLFGAAMGPDISAKKVFGSLLSGTGGIGSVITALLYLGALIYFNAYYFMRSVIVSFLMILGPIAISMIGINEEYKRYYKQWAAGIISYIAIQPIHAVILAVLLLMPSTGRSIEKIVAVYALIPIGKMAKGMLLPDGSPDIASGAGDAAKQRAAAMGQAALNVGANAIAVGAGIGMAKDQEKLRQQEQDQQEQQRQAADGGVGNNFNQNKYDPNKANFGASGQNRQGGGQTPGGGGEKKAEEQQQVGEPPKEKDPLSKEALAEGGGEIEPEKVPAGGPGKPSDNDEGGPGTQVEGGKEANPGEAGKPGEAATKASTESGDGAGKPGDTKPDDIGKNTGDPDVQPGGPDEAEPGKPGGAELAADDLAGGPEDAAGAQPGELGEDGKPLNGGEVAGAENGQPGAEKEKKPGFIDRHLINGGGRIDNVHKSILGYRESRKNGDSITTAAAKVAKGETQAQQGYDERHNSPKRIAARNMRRAAATFAVGGALSIASGGRAGNGLLFMSQRSAATAAGMGERAKAYERRQADINSQFAANQQAQEAAAQTAQENTQIPMKDFKNFTDTNADGDIPNTTSSTLSESDMKDFGINSIKKGDKETTTFDTNENLSTGEKETLEEMSAIYKKAADPKQTLTDEESLKLAAYKDQGYSKVSAITDRTGAPTGNYRVTVDNAKFKAGIGGGAGCEISAAGKGMEVQNATSGAPMFASSGACVQQFKEKNSAKMAAPVIRTEGTGVTVTPDGSGHRTFSYTGDGKGNYSNVTEAATFSRPEVKTAPVPTGKQGSTGADITKDREVFSATVTPSVPGSETGEALARYSQVFETARSEPANQQAQADARHLREGGIYDCTARADGGYDYVCSPQVNDARGGGTIGVSDTGAMTVSNCGNDASIQQTPIIPILKDSSDYKTFANEAKQAAFMARKNGGADPVPPTPQPQPQPISTNPDPVPTPTPNPAPIPPPVSNPTPQPAPTGGTPQPQVGSPGFDPSILDQQNGQPVQPGTPKGQPQRGGGRPGGGQGKPTGHGQGNNGRTGNH